MFCNVVFHLIHLNWLHNALPHSWWKLRPVFQFSNSKPCCSEHLYGVHYLASACVEELSTFTICSLSVIHLTVLTAYFLASWYYQSFFFFFAKCIGWTIFLMVFSWLRTEVEHLICWLALCSSLNPLFYRWLIFCTWLKGTSKTISSKPLSIGECFFSVIWF